MRASLSSPFALLLAASLPTGLAVACSSGSEGATASDTPSETSPAPSAATASSGGTSSGGTSSGGTSSGGTSSGGTSSGGTSSGGTSSGGTSSGGTSSGGTTDAGGSDASAPQGDASPPPPTPLDDTEWEAATACPGNLASYSQLIAKFPPATTEIVFGTTRMAARKRACHDQTGCAAWQPSSETPFGTITWSANTGYTFPPLRSVAMPQAAKATLVAGASSLTLRLTVDAEPTILLASTVNASGNNAPDFQLNPFRLDGQNAQPGTWSSGSGSYVWFHQDKVTTSCIFATASGRVYGPSSNGSYTEHQVVFLAK